MSADEFDPFVERLFARTPNLPDAALFNARVEARLVKGTRLRAVVLSLAGLIGGVVAVRETLNLKLAFGGGEAGAAVTGVGQGFHAATVGAQSSIQSGLDQMGLANLEWGSMGGMQLFWIAAGGLIAVAAAGAVKLAQDI